VRNRICSVTVLPLVAGTPVSAESQGSAMQGIRGHVDFSGKRRDWDGFGFNDVELAHTDDYETFQQGYGGFSLLDEKEKQAGIGIEGTAARLFEAYQTPENGTRQYTYIGDFEVKDGHILCNTPAGSVTTFFAKAAKEP